MRNLAFFAILAGLAMPVNARSPQVERIDVFEAVYGEWRALDDEQAVVRPAIVVSKAADGQGRPIDFSSLTLAKSRSQSMSRLSAAPFSGGIPLAAARLTSGFGMRRDPLLGGRRAHSGIDLGAPIGSPVIATADGVVRTANWVGGYGLLVALEHGGGTQTRYGHLSRLNVFGGQAVRKGDVIGFVGSTGRSTGPHLHYEVRVNGRAVNPADAIRR